MISVILPAYNEEQSVDRLLSQIEQVMTTSDQWRLEIVMANSCSCDVFQKIYLLHGS